MAGSAAAALALLVTRIEGTTPTRDPKIRYRHRTTDVATPPERFFTIVPKAGLEQAAASLGDPVTLRFHIVVHYDNRTERFERFTDRLTDMEDLVKRVRYVNGGEWAQSSGYAFVIENASIEDGEVVLDLACLYNLTVE